MLVPIYLLFRDLAPARHAARRSAFVLMMVNLPIIIWMLYTYFKEIPVDILEAARMDGASLRQRDHLCADADGDARHRLDDAAVDHPVVERGVLDAQPHDANAAPLTRSSPPIRAPRACSGPSCRRPRLLAIAPILILGWFSQKQLVRGLTFGAVK